MTSLVGGERRGTEEERGPAETARNIEASGKKTRGLGKWNGLGRGAKLLGDFASYLISPEILSYTRPPTRSLSSISPSSALFLS